MISKYFVFFYYLFFFLNQGYSQSFEWESEPEIYLCNVSFTKIIENDNFELIVIGDKNCNNNIFKFNKFGQLLCEATPFNKGRIISDLIYVKEKDTYFLIGAGLPFPSRSNLFEMNENCEFINEWITITSTYYTEFFCNKNLNQNILTAGYSFSPNQRYCPVLEYRSLNGDTLGKFEYPLPWNAQARKVYVNNEDNSIMLFCSENGYGKITFLNADTSGNLLELKVWDLNNDYALEYNDMAKKGNSYHMIVWLTLSNKIERGYYLFNFNAQGDSTGMQLLNQRYNSIAATKDNGLVLAGTSLLKLDSNLKVVWEKPFREGVEIQSIGESKLGGYYGSGRIYNKALKEYRTYIFRTNANGDIETTNNYPNYQIYPNPFKGELKFELPFGEAFNISLYDMQGKKVVDVNCIGSTFINPDFLSQGVYWANITNQMGLSLYSQKLVKLK